MQKAPSCKDIGEKHDPTVKRQAMLFFEFISGLDHMYHVTNEATQDHFRHIHADIERITSTFTYADEQQMDALEKKRKKEMLQQQLELAGSIIDIVFAVVSLGTAGAGLSTAKVAASATRLSNLSRLSGVLQRPLRFISNGRIGRIASSPNLITITENQITGFNRRCSW